MEKTVKVSNTKEVYLDPTTVLMIIAGSSGFADILTSIGGKIETDMAPASVKKLIDDTITANLREQLEIIEEIKKAKTV